MSSKLVCSYTYTKQKYTKQHYYHCHTCQLVGNVGICDVCANRCHAGHFVEYKGVSGSFYCNCGHRGPNFCASMTPTLPESQSQDTCSVSVTHKRPTFQHYYHCTTCNIVGNLGVCELCAKVCHDGHSVLYAGFSPHFYCDCGTGNTALPHRCKCIVPRSKAREEIHNIAKYALSSSSSESSTKPSAASISEAEVEVTLNAKRALDREKCSIVTYGKQYVPQHYYHCSDCGLVGGTGCCETCARNCHRGHRVTYAGMSNGFFCDCGDGKACRSLKPVQVVPSHMLETLATCAEHNGLQMLNNDLKGMNLLDTGKSNNHNENKEKADDKEEEEEEDKYMCKICWDNPINTVILECGHQALCSDCMESKTWSLCPICNTTVTKIMKTYLS